MKYGPWWSWQAWRAFWSELQRIQAEGGPTPGYLEEGAARDDAEVERIYALYHGHLTPKLVILWPFCAIWVAVHYGFARLGYSAARKERERIWGDKDIWRR